MARLTKSFVLQILLVLAARGPLHGQHPFDPGSVSFELRGELARPTSEVRSRFDLESGYGLGVTARYWLNSIASFYAGWDRFRFEGGDSVQNTKVIDSGFRLGAMLVADVWTRADPFASGGVIVSRSRISREDGQGRMQATPDGATGYEVGGGLLIPLWDGIWAVPEARYRSHSNADDSLDLEQLPRTTYIGFNLGIIFRL